MYGFPVLFYLYFYLSATHNDFRAVIVSVLVSGIMVGLYFVYDSFAMLSLQNVSEYSIKAFEYSKFRASSIDINDARVSPGYRSHGLLESHSISAAWVAFSGFAALSLMRDSKFKQKIAVIIFFSVMLIAAQNYTAIASFFLVILIIQLKGYIVLRGAIPVHLIRASFLTIVILLFIFIIALPALGFSDFIEVLSSLFEFQILLATGQANYKDTSYFTELINGIIYYPINAMDFPFSILIGDGFSSYGVIKGGDFGVVESLHRFGLPFFILVLGGIFVILTRALNLINSKSVSGNLEYEIILFATSIVTYLLCSEIHYSIWNGKSVLPIFFICLAILARFSRSYRRPSSLGYSQSCPD